MNELLLFIVLIVIAVIIYACIKDNKSISSKESYITENLIKHTEPPPQTLSEYIKKDTLLTPAERSFYGVLRLALSDAYQVQTKVRLADILMPQKGLSRSDWQIAFNRIARKHIDFVLVDPKTTEVVLAIELDDSSHAREDRRQRDEFVDAAMQSAGLTLIHFPAKNAYSVQEVRSMLGLSTPPQPTTPASQPLESAPKPAPLKSETAQSATSSCPKCAAPMVKRQASRGEHAGKLFWACSRYPECKSILAIKEEPQTVKA